MEWDELDNCPVCNTTVILKKGFAAGAFESGEEEVCFATAKFVELSSGGEKYGSQTIMRQRFMQSGNVSYLR